MGENLKLELPCLEATVKLGRILADAIIESGSCCVVALSGDLGAGKTTLVKAVGVGLGVSEVVASPTFTMMNEYHSGRLPVYHFDFYRIGEALAKAGQSPPLDLLAMEFDEITNGKVVAMIEWPEFFLVQEQHYLDEVDHLSIALSPSSRDVTDSSLAVNASSKAVNEESADADVEEQDMFDEGRAAVIMARGEGASKLLELLRSRTNGEALNK